MNKKILVINGPNLNMLGIRQPEIYGRDTYDGLLDMLRQEAQALGVSVSFFQSNPGAYTHTSVALLDAVKTVMIPTVEVHISDPDTREEFRHISYIREACAATIKGRGLQGYKDAMAFLCGMWKK